MHKNRLALVLLGCLVAGSAFAAPAVFGESASVKVRPSHAVRDDRGVDLVAAKNEFVSFQVVVHGATTGGTGISASFSGLNGPSTIGADKAVLYREALINVTQPSGGTASTGMWPDGLIPDVDEIDGQKRKAFPFDVPANQARALWVDVQIPANAAPGQYTGAVTVSGAGFSHQVPVRLTVVNASMPSTSSMKSAFLIYGGNVCLAHTGSSDCAGSTTTMSNHLNRYQRLALDHRLTLSNVYKVGRQADNWSGFDAMYTPFLEGTAGTRLAGAKVTTAQITATRDQAKFKAWADHFKTKPGWFDRLFDYTGDEPPYGITFDEARVRATMTKSADPALRTLLTTNIAELQSHGLDTLFDTIVPVVNYMDGTAAPYVGNQRSKYDGYLSKPAKQLWMYQSCMSHGCAFGTNLPENLPNSGWPSYMIDRSAAKNRAMQWIVFKYDATGELYYETAMALQNAWTNQFQFAGNGDGTLFYPGTPAQIGGTSHVPLPSIRLKQIRLGMQDYEWLKLVADAGDPQFAKSIVNGLIPAASKVGDDGAAFDAARLKLIQRYVQLKAPEQAEELPKVGSGTGTGAPVITGEVGELPSSGTTTTEPTGATEQPVWTEGRPYDDTMGGAQGMTGCSATSVAPAGLGLLALLAAARRRRSR